ncbi:MAG: hypothetical protein WAO23_03495 [Dethiobacteria bacterium]
MHPETAFCNLWRYRYLYRADGELADGRLKRCDKGGCFMIDGAVKQGGL